VGKLGRSAAVWGYGIGSAAHRFAILAIDDPLFCIHNLDSTVRLAADPQF